MTLAKKFRSKINSVKNFDEKLYQINIIRKEALMNFGDNVDKLKFKDNSKLKINAKLKASLLN